MPASCSGLSSRVRGMRGKRTAMPLLWRGLRLMPSKPSSNTSVGLTLRAGPNFLAGRFAGPISLLCRLTGAQWIDALSCSAALSSTAEISSLRRQFSITSPITRVTRSRCVRLPSLTARMKRPMI